MMQVELFIPPHVDVYLPLIDADQELKDMQKRTVCECRQDIESHILTIQA